MTERFLALTAILAAILMILSGPAAAVDGVSTATLANLAVIDLADEALAARRITRAQMGELVLPTGKVVATDPLVFPERTPFERTVAPGRYPVEVYIAQHRIAIAVLRLAPGKVERWEIATAPGQDVKTLKEGEIFGYGVDAGLGSFMDAAAPAAIKKRGETSNRYDNYYDDVLSNELPGRGDDRVMHRPLRDDPVNVAIFSSGWGDGFYASYWGFGANGRTLVLATEFGVLENGDGHSSFDRRQDAARAAIAAMTPEQRDHAHEAYEALKRGDADRLRAILSFGLVTPDTYVAEVGVTFVTEAIRLDRPEALEHLVRYGARLEMDAPTAEDFGVKTYPEYARSLDAPQPTPELYVPTPGFKPRPANSAALKDVIARWQAGAIPLSDNVSPRKADQPPPDETKKP